MNSHRKLIIKSTETDKIIKTLTLVLGLAILIVATPEEVFASGQLESKISSIQRGLTRLIAVGSGVGLAAGALMMIMGMGGRGVSIIRSSAIGIVIASLIPSIVSFLSTAGG